MRPSRFATLPLALALCACAAVGPNYQAPAAPTVAGYAAARDPAPAGVSLTPEARAAGPWWQVLGSPELDAVIRQALADSPSVAEAAATLQKANARSDAARGALAPEIGANGGGQRERINTAAFGFSGFPSPTINLFQIGAAVNYDLDLFGGKRRAQEEAQARAEAEARRADVAYLTLSANVALQAVRIAAAQAQLAALDQVIAGDQSTLDMTRRAQAAGGAAPSALSGGEGELARDQAMRPALEQDLTQARHQLALLVGHAPADYVVPDFRFESFTVPADIPVELPSALVHRRPDILAAEAEFHAATAAIGVATADLYPDVKLGVSLTQEAIEPGALFRYSSSAWNLAGGVTAPIFNGGRLQARKRAAEADARIALARYQQTVLRAFVEVSDILAALAEDQKAIEALTRAQAARAANLKDSQTAYRLGGGPMLAVVDAQRQLNRASRDLIAAQGRRMTDVVNLSSVTAAKWKPN
jgi:NodT family efflux transporter outer membrane factor (OMF) lipoprotein